MVSFNKKGGQKKGYYIILYKYVCIKSYILKGLPTENYQTSGLVSINRYSSNKPLIFADFLLRSYFNLISPVQGLISSIRKCQVKYKQGGKITEFGVRNCKNKLETKMFRVYWVRGDLRALNTSKGRPPPSTTNFR